MMRSTGSNLKNDARTMKYLLISILCFIGFNVMAQNGIQFRNMVRGDSGDVYMVETDPTTGIMEFVLRSGLDLGGVTLTAGTADPSGGSPGDFYIETDTGEIYENQATVWTLIMDDTDTQLTQEQVEDFAGLMVTGNTESLITVTYQDGTGDIDFVVDPNLSHYTNDAGFITSATAARGVTDQVNALDIELNGNNIEIALDPSENATQAPALADLVIIEDVTDGGIHSATLTQLRTRINTNTQRGVTDQGNALDISLNGNNIEIALDPSENATQAPALADLVIIEDATDGGIHAATLTQLQTRINTNTQLSNEQVEDIAGNMVTGNTETLIAVTYRDNTGDIDFVVDPNLSHYTNDAGFVTSATAARGVTDQGNALDISLNGNNIEIGLDPSENSTQTPSLSDLVIVEDVTDGGIHAATMTQLQTRINTNTQLSNEQVEDIAGNMVTGNTETLIAVTYRDNTGDIDFIVDPNLSHYTNDAGFVTSATAARGVTDQGNALDISLNGNNIEIGLDPSENSTQTPSLSDLVIVEDVTDGGIHAATMTQLRTAINTNTHLSREAVEDIAGAMVSGNTESLITVTYRDNTGDIDFVVDPNLSHYTNDAGFVTSASAHRGVTDLLNGLDITLSNNNILIQLDPNENATQVPALGDFIIVEDATDGGIHAATLTQLQTAIGGGGGTPRGVTDQANGLDISLNGNNIEIALDPSENSTQAAAWLDLVIIEDVTDGGIHSATLGQLQDVIDTQRGVYNTANGLDIYITNNTITVGLDPSETATQAPDLADLIIVQDVTDGGIHSATLTQLQTAIGGGGGGTDNQTLDVASFLGDNLRLSLSGDGQATKVIDLSSVNHWVKYISGDNTGGISFNNLVGIGAADPGYILSVNPPSALVGVEGIKCRGDVLFRDDLDIEGTLTKGAGSFRIDHPLDPYNKYLQHSFVESPDMMNVYNGNIICDKEGVAKVELPDYFLALNKDYRYQLTPIGAFANLFISKEIEPCGVDASCFSIAGGAPGLKVSWQVTGIRNDTYARNNPIVVVTDKTEPGLLHYK